MIYKLLPPNDPRVLSGIAPFDKDEFKKEEKIEIKENETSETLTAKMSEVSSSKILQIIDLIDKNNFKLTPQNSSNATYAPKIMKEEAKINWDESAIKIVNLIKRKILI